MKSGKAVFFVILAGLCAVYISLRLWNLTASCLWFDEIFGVHAAAGHDWGGMLRFVAQDLIHPPLFYALLKIWISAGGEGLLWLRLFPVFFSALALLPFYLLCRRLNLSDAAIILALAFLAASGSLVKYAQEVRMYSLLLCLSLFSLWLFARHFALGKSLAWLTLVNILLVYTHYFGWLVVASEVLAVLAFKRTAARRILAMAGVVFLSFAPWIYALWRAAKTGADVTQNIGWMSKPNFTALLQFALDLVEPFYYQQSSAEPGSRLLVTVPLLLILGAAAVFYFANWKNEPEKSSFYLSSVFAAAPVAVAFAASWLLPVSVWGTRHLIVVFAPVYILLAKFLTGTEFARLKNVFTGILLLLFAAAFVLQLKTAQPKFIWCAWEELAKSVDLGRPQKIYVFEDLTAYHFWFATRESDRVQVVKVRNLPGTREDAAYFLPRGFDRVRTADDFEGHRFSVAFRAAGWDESAPPLLQLRAKGYRLGGPRVFEAQGETAFLVEAVKTD